MRSTTTHGDMKLSEHGKSDDGDAGDVGGLLVKGGHRSEVMMTERKSSRYSFK
jgi:hypothetical protein